MKRKLTIGLLAVLAVLSVATAPALAQNENGTYYENETTETNEDVWLSGLTDASLDDIVTLALRLGGFIIGDGAAQGGVGSAGTLLTGLLVAGVMGGIGIRSGAGAAGGAVIAIAGASAFATVGIGATWAYPVVLFVAGLVVAGVLLKIFR